MIRLVWCLKKIEILKNNTILVNVYFLIRLVGCPKKIEFLQDKMNLVDVLAIMPYYVELAMREEQKEKASS